MNTVTINGHRVRDPDELSRIVLEYAASSHAMQTELASLRAAVAKVRAQVNAWADEAEPGTSGLDLLRQIVAGAAPTEQAQR